ADAAPRRGRARLCLCDRRRLPGACRRVPRRRAAVRSRCRGRRLVARAAKRRRSCRVGPGASPIRPGLTVVLTRPAERSGQLAGRPDELGADSVALYRTRTVRPTQPLQGDLVVLASASAAGAYAELGVSIPAVSIGPATTAAAREAGVRVVEEARTHDLDGLVEAVLAASA